MDLPRAEPPLSLRDTTREVAKLATEQQTNRAAPTAVAGGLAFASLSAVRAHVCGLVATGVAYWLGR